MQVLKAKWLPGEALQIAVKRREPKSKGEKERYKHLNAEFQRIARRDKKAFLSPQCKDRGKQQNGKDQRSLEENQRYQGNFSCKDGLDKRQKWYGPNRSKKILRRDGKNTQKNCTKRIFKTKIITMV